jgi:mannose-6-phosphate isomerase-like protein (cupin superfamily)
MKGLGFALALLSLSASAQQAPAPAMPPGGAPATGANAEPRMYISAAEIAERTAKAAAAAKAGTQYNGAPLVASSAFRANLEYHDAPATAVNTHDNDDELFVVIEGSGTMTLGGSLVNATRRGDSMTAATSVGGKPYKLKKGDMVMVPHNTPHAVTQVDGKLVLMSLHLPLPTSAPAAAAGPAPGAGAGAKRSNTP